MFALEDPQSTPPELCFAILPPVPHCPTYPLANFDKEKGAKAFSYACAFLPHVLAKLTELLSFRGVYEMFAS